MTLLPTIGILLALGGSVLGLAGAYYTGSKDKKTRKLGFFCWVINSPMIVLSLIGVVIGLWESLTIIALIPLNTLYFITAIRGWINNGEP